MPTDLYLISVTLLRSQLDTGAPSDPEVTFLAEQVHVVSEDPLTVELTAVAESADAIARLEASGLSVRVIFTPEGFAKWIQSTQGGASGGDAE